VSVCLFRKKSLHFLRAPRPGLRGKTHEALTQDGYEVWYDRFLAGEYRQEISDAIRRADQGVVVWSRASVDSSFVRDEANHLVEGGKYVPIRIDVAKLPLGFGEHHVFDLTGWDGSADHSGWTALRRRLASPTVLTGAFENGIGRTETTLNRIARAATSLGSSWRRLFARAAIGLVFIALTMIAVSAHGIKITTTSRRLLISQLSKPIKK
jgi:hypothetical protein